MLPFPASLTANKLCLHSFTLKNQASCLATESRRAKGFDFFVMLDVTQLQFSQAKQEVFFVFLLSLLVIFTVIVSVKTN